jgi:hypothetical protein
MGKAELSELRSVGFSEAIGYVVLILELHFVTERFLIAGMIRQDHDGIHRQFIQNKLVYPKAPNYQAFGSAARVNEIQSVVCVKCFVVI